MIDIKRVVSYYTQLKEMQTGFDGTGDRVVDELIGDLVEAHEALLTVLRDRIHAYQNMLDVI